MWEEGFNYLAAYKEEFGDCLVKGGQKYGDYNLGNWVRFQLISQDQLAPERVKRLDDLGFVWKVE